MRRPGALVVHVAVLVLLLVAGFLVGRSQPLVRNGLVYAKAAWNVIEAGYDPRPVVADSRRSYDKPIGFAWMAAPLVSRVGAHDGLRVASLAGTIAYVFATLFLARTLLGAAADRRSLVLVLWLATFGPLVVYQGWSAHPDSWFAALFAVVVALTHRIATGDDEKVVGRSALLALALTAAFLLKNYGLILLPACALYVAIHVPRLRRLRNGGGSVARRVVACGTALLLVAAFILAARFGKNPFSRLEGEGGGAEQYALRDVGSIWWKTLAQCGLALALQFHLTFAALRRSSLAREVVLPSLWFGVVYVAGLLPFPTAFYNMRYFMPLFPLVAIALARGASSLRPGMQTAFAAAFLSINAVTIAVFNVPPLFDNARPSIPSATVTWLANGPPLSLLDNLRMQQHRDQSAWLRTIEENVEPGATLYLLDVVYYRDAQQRVFERDAWIRPDITTHYASRRDFHPSEPRFYVWSYSPAPLRLDALGTVTDFGNRVVRVDRPTAK